MVNLLTNELSKNNQAWYLKWVNTYEWKISLHNNDSWSRYRLRWYALDEKLKTQETIKLNSFWNDSSQRQAYFQTFNVHNIMHILPYGFHQME